MRGAPDSERAYLRPDGTSACRSRAWVGCTFARVLVESPGRSLEAVEFATLVWVDWFDTRRWLEPTGYVPPAEYEARYYEQAKVA